VFRPQKNGLAEAAIKSLTTTGMCNLAASQLNHQCFPYAVNHAAAVDNVIPKGPNNQSALFLLNGTPTYGNELRTFGCIGYVLDPHASKSKLMAPGHPARFLGFLDFHHT
jgi:hypothetical protein